MKRRDTRETARQTGNRAAAASYGPFGLAYLDELLDRYGVGTDLLSAMRQESARLGVTLARPAGRAA